MSENEPQKNILVMGAIINENIVGQELRFIHEIVTYFMAETWKRHGTGEYPPDDITLTACVEGDSEACAFNKLVIGFATKETLGEMVSHFDQRYQDAPDVDTDETGPDAPTIMVGVGTREFCQTWVKYWANKPGELPTWGSDLITTIDASNNGAVVWVNETEAGVNTSDIFAMRKDFRAQLGLPE